ncbi:hypothetical protein BN1723_020361, partial [Verticillium longisporum]
TVQAQEGQGQRHHVRRSPGCRKDDNVHKARPTLPGPRPQGLSRVRRHVPSRRLRPAEAERHQGQDPLLRLPHRDGPGRRRPRGRRQVQEGALRGHHCRHVRPPQAGGEPV